MSTTAQPLTEENLQIHANQPENQLRNHRHRREDPKSLEYMGVEVASSATKTYYLQALMTEIGMLNTQNGQLSWVIENERKKLRKLQADHVRLYAHYEECQEELEAEINISRELRKTITKQTKELKKHKQEISKLSNSLVNAYKDLNNMGK